MKIVIVGAGYVGLVTAACLAEIGINVVCIDIDQSKIDAILKGIMPIYEPDLETIVLRNAEKGRLSFSTSLATSIKDADAIFIAVGTPPGEDGSADLQYVLQVAEEIGNHIEDYAVVVTKSTVPVGTSMKVKDVIQQKINERNLNIEFDVASNPEFLKEGVAVRDFMKPDRIIIGTETERAEKLLEKLYKPFMLNGHPILSMDIPSAELTKYAANTMLATRISFMNDIANLCEKVGADINQIRKGIGSDPRIGDRFLYAGVGYGGSCFPKDVKALIKIANDNDMHLDILEAVESINNNQKNIPFQKINKHFNGDLTDKTIAIWGLAFKPNTDDIREAPSVVLIEQLLKAGASIQVTDPAANENIKAIFGNQIQYYDEIYSCAKNAACIAMITEWNEFRLPDWDRIKNNMQQLVLIDGRNIYDASFIESIGFSYYGIGQ